MPAIEIRIPHEFCLLANDWHNGPDTVLGEIAHTGSVSFPTGRRRSPERAHVARWDQLDAELGTIIVQVDRRNRHHEDIPGLDRFRDFAERTTAQLRKEYGV